MATFVRAGECDVELISQLGNEIFREHYTGILSDSQIEYMLKMMYSAESLRTQMQNNNTFFIVYDNGVACGYIAVEQMSQSSFHLQKLYLRSTMRGKKIGRQMIQKVYDHAKEVSPKGATITLNVNRENPTLDFYRKLGWEIIERGDFDLGEGFFANDYIMRITI